jgi:hypothetical protein
MCASRHKRPRDKAGFYGLFDLDTAGPLPLLLGFVAGVVTVGDGAGLAVAFVFPACAGGIVFALACPGGVLVGASGLLVGTAFGGATVPTGLGSGVEVAGVPAGGCDGDAVAV